MTISELSNVLIKYIEDNKIKNDIDYLETIEVLEEVIKEIKKEYEAL